MGKKHDKLVEELGQYVRERFELAKNTKREQHDILLDCLRQVRGELLACESLDPEIDVNFNITSPIVKGIVGLIRDVFSNSIETPFVIKATPQADLDETQTKNVLQAVMAQLQQMPMMTSDMLEQAAAEQGQMLKNAAMQEQQKLAAVAADKMNTLIQDRLHDADWLRQFGDFIYNFVVYPAAIMKTPAVIVKPWKRWNGQRMVVERKLIRGVENISPFDFYPAPNAQSVQDAEYVIEVRRCSRSELVGYYSAPGFDGAGIKDVLSTYPTGWLEEREDGKEHNPEVDTDKYSIGLEDDAQGFYDCVGFYGAIRGELLEEFGVEVGSPDATYEAEIWTVNDIVIKAVLNPDPAGQRPFYVASFEPIPGAFWGECPVTRLRDVQRVCTATIVAMVRNMGLASGVLGEVESDRVIDDEDVNVIVPNTLREVKSVMGMQGRAYNFYTVPDISHQLLNVFERFMQYGYETIGIPRVAFGSTENIGTLGRTSGGVAMVLNQASKSVKFALRVLEENIIEPVVQSYIDYELMYSMDETIKGDIRVHARGVSGIVEKESQESKLQWALQSLSAYTTVVDQTTGQPIVPPAAIQRLLYQIFKISGISTEGIFPDFDLQSAVTQDIQSLNPLYQGGTIDGRNASAGQAIAAQNSLTPNSTMGGM
nr:MAG TPA: Portal protein [Caudoviricetes sp.]